MQYSIKINGRQEPLIVNEDVGSQIKTKFFEYKDNKNKNYALDIEEWAGMVSDIRSIEKLKNGFSGEKTKNNQTSGIIAEFKEYHKKARTKSPEVKCLSGFMNMAHWIFTGRRLEEEPQENKDKIIKILKPFFEKNPNRIYPDLIELKKIYSNKSLDVGQGKGLGILDQALTQDIYQQRGLQR